MFRPRPNAAGGPSKDGPGTQSETSPNPIGTDGSVAETPTSLPVGTGEESFITRMMADK
jgi:hypothetical protein